MGEVVEEDDKGSGWFCQGTYWSRFDESMRMCCGKFDLWEDGEGTDSKQIGEGVVLVDRLNGSITEKSRELLKIVFHKKLHS